MNFIKLRNNEVGYHYNVSTRKYTKLDNEVVYRLYNKLVDYTEMNEGEKKLIIHKGEKTEVFISDTPNKCFISLTNKCNLRCIHCFTNSGETIENELIRDEQIKVIRELEKCGIMDISLSGGEPLILSYFYDILHICDQLNMSVSLTTNGMLINENFIDMLTKITIRSITISLDSLKDDKVRVGSNIVQIKKNINDVSKCIRINNLSTKLNIRTCVNKLNTGELEDIIKFCDSIKINTLKVNNTNSLGRAKEISHLLLDDNDFNKIAIQLRSVCEKNDVRLEIPIEKYITEKEIMGKCRSGYTTFNIMPNGNVEPCGFVDGKLLLGNVRYDSIENIFRKKLFSLNNKICSKCKMNGYVGKKSIIQSSSIVE